MIAYEYRATWVGTYCIKCARTQYYLSTGHPFISLCPPPARPPLTLCYCCRRCDICCCCLDMPHAHETILFISITYKMHRNMYGISPNVRHQPVSNARANPPGRFAEGRISRPTTTGTSPPSAHVHYRLLPYTHDTRSHNFALPNIYTCIYISTPKYTYSP